MIGRTNLRGHRGRGILGAAACAVVALVLSQATPLFTLSQLDVLTTLFGYLLLAQAWNILAGFSGQISLGTAAFVGCGAYTMALLALHANVGYQVALAGSMVTGILLAAVLAVPLLRLRGDYFAVGTLAAALAVQAWILNWEFAGGSTGLSLPLGSIPDSVSIYQVACGLAALAMIVAFLVSNSTFGNRLRAIRDDEGAAVGLGVRAFRHRMAALVICGGLSGLGGGLIALQQISFEPVGMLGIGWTISALLMAVVGGLGTVLGPVVGAVIVYYLLTRQLQDYQTLSIVIEGALLIGVVRFAPQGVWPLLAGGVRRLVLTRARGEERDLSQGTRGSDDGGRRH